MESSIKKNVQINTTNFMDDLHKSETAWKDWQNKARTADDMYLGKQWSDQAISVRNSRNKPTVTLNITQPFVNVIVGSKRQTRLMPKAFPKKTDGMAIKTAELITKITRNVYSESRMREIDGLVFQDSVISGRGGWKLKKGYNDNNKPQLYVKYQDQLKIFPDFNVPKEDLQFETARFIYEVSYHSKEFLMEKFPFVNWDSLSHKIDKSDKTVTDVDYKEGLYRVVQKYELKREGYDYYHSLTDGEIKFKVKSGTEQAEIKEANPDLYVIENQTEKVLYYSIVVPAYSQNTALVAGKHPLQMGRYPFIFSHAYVGNRGSYGVVANLEETQKRMNTVRSLMLEALSKITVLPWFIEDGSLVNGVDNFNKQITKSGGDILIAKGRKAPYQPQQAGLPPALSQYNLMLETDARTATGITPAAEGRSEGANEPASLYRQKLAQTNKTLAVIYDRFDDAQQYLWQSVIESIGDVYTEEDVLAINIDDTTDPTSKDSNNEGVSIENVSINKKAVANSSGKIIEVVLNKIGNTVNAYLVNMEMVQATANDAEEHLTKITEFLQVFNDPTLNSLVAPTMLKSSNLPKAHILAKQYLEAKQAQAQAAAQQAQSENSREDLTTQTRAEKNRAEVKSMEVQDMKEVGAMESTLAQDAITDNYVSLGAEV